LCDNLQEATPMDDPPDARAIEVPGAGRASRFQQPSAQQIAGFREGDPIAIDEVVSIVLPQIARWATSRFSSIPTDDVLDVVYQVLSETCQHHARYDPARGRTFTSYVIDLLNRRLTDVSQAWQEMSAHEESGPRVDEALLCVPSDIEGALDRDIRIVRDDFLRRVAAELDDVERDLWHLMLEGNKDTEVAAAILARRGSVTDVQREVKNAKARLMRKGGRSRRRWAIDWRISYDAYAQRWRQAGGRGCVGGVVPPRRQAAGLGRDPAAPAA
jgi:hypothetical protein